MITHIVFFKFQEPKAENAAKAKEMLMGLQGKVPTLRHIEVGLDVMHSQRSFDLALYSKFDSLEDLEAYNVHPEHKKVTDFIATVREASAAVDYES